MAKAALIVAAILAQIVVMGLSMVAEEQAGDAKRLKAAHLPVRTNGVGAAFAALIAAVIALWFAYTAGAEG